jgi:hypothetical protein
VCSACSQVEGMVGGPRKEHNVHRPTDAKGCGVRVRCARMSGALASRNAGDCAERTGEGGDGWRGWGRWGQVKRLGALGTHQQSASWPCRNERQGNSSKCSRWRRQRDAHETGEGQGCGTVCAWGRRARVVWDVQGRCGTVQGWCGRGRAATYSALSASAGKNSAGRRQVIWATSPTSAPDPAAAAPVGISAAFPGGNSTSTKLIELSWSMAARDAGDILMGVGGGGVGGGDRTLLETVAHHARALHNSLPPHRGPRGSGL